MAEKHKALYILFLLETIIYIDRGIIPGCTLAISTFIAEALDTKMPSFYLGIVQGAFIGGLSLFCLVFTYANNYLSLHKCISLGLIVWLLAGILVGLVPYTKSFGFYTLLIGRILSGVGEGALISLVPPYILKHTSENTTGHWMGVFCAILPIGVAIGYMFGGAVSSSLGWNFSFFILSSIAAVIIIIFIFFPFAVNMGTDDIQERALTPSNTQYQKMYKNDKSPTDVENSDSRTIECKNDIEVKTETKFIQFKCFFKKIWTEVFADVFCILSIPQFLFLAGAYASYSAVVIAFSTFGSAYLQGLQFVENEFIASLVMGAMVAGLGVLGGFAGGFISTMSIKRSIRSLNSDIISNENEEKKERLQSESLSFYLLPVTILSFLFLVLTSFMRTTFMFLAFLSLGLFFIFCTQSSLNIATMLVVPKYLRSFSIAISTVFLHIFGDVPAPIILGSIKDILSPHCSKLDKNTNTVFPECYKEGKGLRITILIIAVWLGWMILGVFATYISIRRKRIQDTNIQLTTTTSQS